MKNRIAVVRKISKRVEGKVFRINANQAIGDPGLTLGTPIPRSAVMDLGGHPSHPTGQVRLGKMDATLFGTPPFSTRLAAGIFDLVALKMPAGGVYPYA